MNAFSPADFKALSTDVRISTLREAVTESATLPLQRAMTLPPAAYTDESWFQFEADTLMKPGWLCVAHVSQVKNPGDYVRIDMLDEPMLVIRDHDGSVRVLSRVCPHRGADIMPDTMGFKETGTAKSLVCPYHRWSFAFDGPLKGCPHMERAEGFQKSDWSLARIRTEIMEGFVFINLSGDAAPLAQHYSELQSLLAPWKAASMELVIEMEWDCHFNWKIMVENWMEAYHHMGSHHSTLNPVMPAEMTWTEHPRENFIRVHLPLAPHLAEEVKRSVETGTRLAGFDTVADLPLERQQEWDLYVGLPFFMFLSTRDRVIWYRLIPVGADRCKLLTTTLVTPSSLKAADFADTLEVEKAMLRDFHVEDMEVNAAVQHGLRSAHAVRGRLSHLEEPIWLIQRWLNARMKGEVLVPQA